MKHLSAFIGSKGQNKDKDKEAKLALILLMFCHLCLCQEESCCLQSQVLSVEKVCTSRKHRHRSCRGNYHPSKVGKSFWVLTAAAVLADSWRWSASVQLQPRHLRKRHRSGQTEEVSLQRLLRGGEPGHQSRLCAVVHRALPAQLHLQHLRVGSHQKWGHQHGNCSLTL